MHYLQISQSIEVSEQPHLGAEHWRKEKILRHGNKTQKEMEWNGNKRWTPQIEVIAKQKFSSKATPHLSRRVVGFQPEIWGFPGGKDFIVRPIPTKD